jgi:hypothetical protein
LIIVILKITFIFSNFSLHMYVSFLPTFQNNFHSLAEQLRKGEPTHIIIKNVVCSNKRDVQILTIGSSNMAPIHSNTLKSKLTVVFNTHIKNLGQVIARKVMILSYLIGVILSFIFMNYVQI